MLVYQELQICRSLAQIFRLLYPGPRYIANQLRKVISFELLDLPVRGIQIHQIVKEFRMCFQVAMHFFIQDGVGFLLINDGIVIWQTGQLRTNMDNIIGETMQGAHAVAKAFYQLGVVQDFTNSAAEVIHGGIGERQDQDFLVVL